MLEGIFWIGMAVGMLFAVWTVGCLIIKGMFKIADWIF